MPQVRPRNEPCPARPSGLWHTPTSPTCQACGARTAMFSDLASVLGPPVPVVRLVAEVPPCENCKQPKEPDRARSRLCADCDFMRRVMFQRFRFEAGDLTEWPDDDRPEEAVG